MEQHFKDYIRFLETNPEREFLDHLPECDPHTVDYFIRAAKENLSGVLDSERVINKIALHEVETHIGSFYVSHDPFANKGTLTVPFGPYMCHPYWQGYGGVVEGWGDNFRVDLPILTETISNDQCGTHNHLWLNSPITLITDLFEQTLDKKKRYKFRKALERDDVWIVREDAVSYGHHMQIEEALLDRWPTRNEALFSWMQWLWGVAAARRPETGHVLTIGTSEQWEYRVCLTRSNMLRGWSTYTLQGIYNRPGTTINSEIALAKVIRWLHSYHKEPVVFDPTFATSPDADGLLVYKRAFINENNIRPLVAAVTPRQAKALGLQEPYYDTVNKQWRLSQEQQILFNEWRV